MTTVQRPARDPEDHAGVRLAPMTGLRQHQKAARAAVPDPDASTREQSFAAGADPQQELRSPVAHGYCDECLAEDRSTYSTARARSVPAHRYVTASRLIAGPNS